MTQTCYSLWRSPFGWMGLAASTRGLVYVTVPRPRRERALRDLRSNLCERAVAGENHHIRRARAALARYFKRDFRGGFQAIALDMQPATQFQRQVWEQLRRIPCGETRTYAEIARALGRPHAARAVGSCNAANRWAIIVPCHRLVGSNGDLTGYGGGLDTKRRLLELEGFDVSALRAMRLAAARQRRCQNAHRN